MHGYYVVEKLLCKVTHKSKKWGVSKSNWA